MLYIKVSDSKNISSIEHDGVDLVVEFTTGGRYRYKNVDHEVVNDFVNAPSKGSFFHSRIKGKFTSERL